jgi:thiol-disulfide isomerase/thioredoxin
MRMIVMTSVVALTLSAVLMFMYPKILQCLGFKPVRVLVKEDFESEIAESEADGGEDQDEDQDEEDDEKDDSEIEGYESEETDAEDEDDESEDSEDDDSVSVGTDSNIETAQSGSKEGFSLFKKAPKAAASLNASSKRLVVFHASWCGHCKTLLSPTGPWIKVKKALPGVTIEELDESKHVDLVKSLGIESFPTIMVLDAASQKAIPYEGPRTKDDIVDFALQNIQPKEI